MKIDESTDEQIIRNNAGLIVDLQSDLLRAVGDDPEWALDLETARISFKSSTDVSVSYDVSLIGTCSAESDTWLWADANASIVCPRKAISKISQIRDAGRSAGLALFEADQFKLSGGITSYGDWDLAYLSAALMGLPIYRCSHDNGAVFVGVEGVQTSNELGIEEFEQRFRRSVSLLLYEKQDEALKRYASLHAFDVSQIPGGLKVSNGKESANFEFRNGFLE